MISPGLNPTQQRRERKLDFELLVPEDEAELFSLMEQGDYRLLAGGTDLFVRTKKKMVNVNRVIDITEVLSGPSLEDKGNKISISSTATFQEIAESYLLKEELPVLAKSAREIGATQLRNMATIGGNICNASPSADSLIALYLLNPELNLVSREGSRHIPIDEFITGPGETDLSQGEYLASLEIPRVSRCYDHYFEKVGRRNALDISVCAMGFLLKKDEDVIEDLRLSYGAVAPTVIRATSVEDFLQGRELNRENLDSAKELLKSEISPISDIRGSADYREKVASRLLDRILDKSKIRQ